MLFLIIDRFGPLSSKGGFLDRMVAVCQEKHFHGAIERTQAEALLAQFKKKGSYIVRLSATEPHTTPFTVSRLTMAKSVEHQRVCSFAFLLQDFENVMHCHSELLLTVSHCLDISIKRWDQLVHPHQKPKRQDYAEN